MSMVGLLVYVIVIGLVCLRWWFSPMASEQADLRPSRGHPPQARRDAADAVDRRPGG
jgi:hypothetical protein